jgi:hypothetical protein
VAGGNRSTRGKPARTSMDWKPNALKADGPSRGLNQGPHWCKASKEPLRQPAPPLRKLHQRGLIFLCRCLCFSVPVPLSVSHCLNLCLCLFFCLSLSHSHSLCLFLCLSFSLSHTCQQSRIYRESPDFQLLKHPKIGTSRFLKKNRRKIMQSEKC